MSLYLQAAISGVAQGLLYGLIGFAIVLLYKATGVANFAQGTLAMLGAFFCYFFAIQNGWPLWLAIIGALVGSALLGVLCWFAVIRPKPEAGNLNITVRTLGLSLLVAAVATQYWGPGAPYRFPAVVDGDGIRLWDVTLNGQVLLIAAVAVTIMTAFWALFKFTSTGLSLRALAEDPDTARLLGLKVSRLTAATWAISCVVGTVVGILLAPTSFLAPEMMDAYLLFTFTGIVVGGLKSLPGALLGCVIVGVVSNVTTIAFTPELGVVVVFVLLLLAMIFFPMGLLGKPEATRL